MDERHSNSDSPLTVLNGTPPEPAALAQQRREQILDAADRIIASEGIHRLSLGNIEEKTGMSRGQLTYYFPKKEAILLAVFDRMLQRMIAQIMQSGEVKPNTGRAWECVRHMLSHRLSSFASDGGNDFTSVVYTFLAQMNHREDYRNKLSGTFDDWRNKLGEDWVQSVSEPRPPLNPRIAASLIQALVHGLTMQLAVDPKAFDPQEMLAACEWLLAPMFGHCPQKGVP